MGYSFADTLLMVLPPSIVISLVQVLYGFKTSSFRFNPISLIVLILSTVLSLYFILGKALPHSFNLILGLALLLSLIMKVNHKLNDFLTKIINKAEPFYMLIMGAIQGVSNLGGGFLTLFALQKTSNKYQTQYIIALTYLIWGVLQIAVVIGLGGKLQISSTLVSLLIASLSFIFANKFLMQRISHQLFSKILIGLIFLYSIVMFGNYFKQG